MSEWKPIETAPKDWTHVIVYDHASDHVCEAYYREEADPSESCWYLANLDGGYEDAVLAEVTHWMPLPAPPSDGV